MKTVVSHVKNAAQEAQQQQHDKPPNQIDRKSSTPQSPLVSQVEKIRSKQPKREPTFKELKPLKDNQWAQMLASPIRACQGSGARLPTTFLTDLGYVRKPGEEDVYLMPVQLVDLEGLEKRMAKELYEEDWRRVRDDKRAARERRENGLAEEPTTAAAAASGQSDADSDSGSKTPTAVAQLDGDSDSASTTTAVISPEADSDQHLRNLPRSRVFSDMTFMRFLTLRLTEPSRGKSQIRQTKRGEVMKLIHRQAKEALTLAQHYIRHKRAVASALGGPTSTAEPLPQKVQERYLRLVQWQHDIPDRVARIMRKRVLVVVKALAEQAMDDIASGKTKNVVALPFPVGSSVDMTSNAQPVSTNGGERIASSTDAGEQAALSTDAGEQTAWPSDHLDIPSDSVFLHIGDNDTSALVSATTSAATLATSSTTPSSSTSSQQQQLPPLPSNPIIPPMLRVSARHRVPVFPMSRMFADPTTDSTDLQDLRALLSGYSDVLRLPQTTSTGNEDYLILVRPGVGPPKALVEEVWQLWRYLGGARMGWMPDSEVEGGHATVDVDGAEDGSNESGSVDDEPAGRNRRWS